MATAAGSGQRLGRRRGTLDRLRARARFPRRQGTGFLLAKRVLLGEARPVCDRVRAGAAADDDVHSRPSGAAATRADPILPGRRLPPHQYDRSRARHHDCRGRHVHGARCLDVLRPMTDTNVSIGLATPDDVEWCARLMATNEPWITLQRDLPACRTALARPGTELLVARDAGAPVGFVLVAPYGFAAAPYIASIAVDPDNRSRGIGSAMLRYVEQHFAGRGHLFLLTSSFNDRAQKV